MHRKTGCRFCSLSVISCLQSNHEQRTTNNVKRINESGTNLMQLQNYELNFYVKSAVLNITVSVLYDKFFKKH